MVSSRPCICGHRPYVAGKLTADRTRPPPGMRAASVVADGYSCRTQIRQATDGDPVHLAHLAAVVLAPSNVPTAP